MKKLVLILISISCLIFGYLFGTRLLPKIKKDIRIRNYNLSFAQKKYSNWNKDKLIVNFADKETLFADYESENDEFAIFFWATWCPFCKAELDLVKDITLKYNIVGLPFDNDSGYFTYFVNKKNVPWGNIVNGIDGNGELEFIARKNDFDVPLIPSIWIIKDGLVDEIFVGSKRIEEFASTL